MQMHSCVTLLSQRVRDVSALINDRQLCLKQNVCVCVCVIMHVPMCALLSDQH